MLDEHRWSQEWGGKVFYSHGSSASRGSCILFNPSLDVTVLNSKLDNHGRFIILDVQILDKTYSIVCIYAPNIDSPSFFDRLSADISGFACESVIIGGDFNFVFNTDIDKKGEPHRLIFTPESIVWS